MEALQQSGSAALVLVGLAAVMVAAAILWRVAGRVRVEEGELALRQACDERVSQQLRHEAEKEQQRMDVLRALLPTATALAGHWLGSRTASAGISERASSKGRCECSRPSEPSPFECIGSGLPLFDPPGPSSATDDETQVELDLPSILAALSEAGFDDWIASVMRKANGSPTGSTPHPEPEAASAVG